LKEALKVYGLGLLFMLAVGLGWEYFQPKPDLPEFAPDFALVDLEGKTHHLEAYRGKRVVLNFWASWCGPCISEIPAFSRLAKDHPEILVLGLSTDRSEAAAQGAVDRLNIPYPVIMAGSVANAYDISTLPTTVVVDVDGRVDSVHVNAMSYRALRRVALP
jgi:thiol-disulfide isomerase/thioredoxin